MELKEFVTESLAQIVEGVVDAQKRILPAGGEVNPSLAGMPPSLLKDSLMAIPRPTGPRQVLLVDFDVAVTVEEGATKKGGIGVVGGVFGLGAQGSLDKNSTALSRIQFRVPLVLPDRPKPGPQKSKPQRKAE